MYDQSKEGSEYLDLITYTDCKKFIFDPYFEINDPEFIDLLYGSGLYRALINAYPLWDMKKGEGLNKGGGRLIFLVFDKEKIDFKEDDYERFTKSGHVAYVEERNDYPRLVVMAVRIPDEVAFRYIRGEYSKMYKKEDLLYVRDMFALDAKDGGILYRAESLSSTFHVLIHSKEYESRRIMQLGFDPSNIHLKELRIKPTLSQERLRLDLLMKQIE